MAQSKADVLIQRASALLKKRYDIDGHHSVVAASVLSKSGKIYTALNLGTVQPSLATCAEMIAIGMGHAAERNFEIDMIVAVRDLPSCVVSPCGRCREYIADYGPRARVIVPADNRRGWELAKISDLIPNKYAKKIK